MEKAKVKRYPHYDDETLEKMKRYYKIDNQDELLIHKDSWTEEF